VIYKLKASLMASTSCPSPLCKFAPLQITSLVVAALPSHQYPVSSDHRTWDRPIVTRPRAGRIGFNSRRGQGDFSKTTRPTLRPAQPPVQWVPGALPTGVKWSGREADYWPPDSASKCHYGVYRNNFTFTFTQESGRSYCLASCHLCFTHTHTHTHCT
jgi:hypothetical protein